MIDGITNADAIPVLERLVQFTGQRHQFIVNNIANLDTPGFRPVDVSVPVFQEQLADAVDARRDGNRSGELDIRDTDEVRVTRAGLTLSPKPIGESILFHDGNDRDLERTMQDLVENFMTFRAATELLRSRFDQINVAIRERI